MKKKNILFVASFFGVAFLLGITALGANELGLIRNNHQKITSAKDKEQEKISLVYDVPNIAQTEDEPTSSETSIEKLSETSSETSIMNDNVREIVTQLEANSYPVLIVQKGVPVKWTIVADNASLNSCNDQIIIPDLNIWKSLLAGNNVIEFTPDQTGIIQYSCWMGMINSAIAVVDDINNYDEAEIQAQIQGSSQGNSGGCCGER